MYIASIFQRVLFEPEVMVYGHCLPCIHPPLEYPGIVSIVRLFMYVELMFSS